MDSEHRARDKGASEWSTFPAPDRIRCIDSIKWFQPTYTQAVEEIVYSERFKTPEEAQKFIDAALHAQRIYRNLTRMHGANHDG